MQLPEHLAIIMDGNGRWAQSRGHSRVYGHVRGASVAKDVIEECCRVGLKNLTLFAFSTENWLRPFEEITLLMRLLERQLRRETRNLIKNNIRFRCIGDLNRLPQNVRTEVNRTADATASCTGMNLVFALSYGGRQELRNAFIRISQQIKDGILTPEDIDDKLIGQFLESAFLPAPDLILRTSGEYRLSNFFLWQAAYSEIIVRDKMWPDFNLDDLQKVFLEYASRTRRFGRTSAQAKKYEATHR